MARQLDALNFASLIFALCNVISFIANRPLHLGLALQKLIYRLSSFIRASLHKMVLGGRKLIVERTLGNADLIATPATAGAHAQRKCLIVQGAWIPAFAGMAGNLNSSAFP